jgi:hypothetical protein
MRVLLLVNWEAVSAIGQIVGALAVVISVIYLTREVRSNARATRLQSMRSLSDAINGYFKTIAQDADLADLSYRGIHDFEPHQGATLLRFSALMDYLFRIYEDMYYQYCEGHLDPSVWSGFEAQLRDINAYPGIQAWWRSRSHWFSKRFGQFVAEAQAAAATPSLYGKGQSVEQMRSASITSENPP